MNGITLRKLSAWAQLPDAVALHHQTVADDQGYGLDRREDVQPYARHHKAHGEAGQTGDYAADECCE
jgi:hypothetical protein